MDNEVSVRYIVAAVKKEKTTDAMMDKEVGVREAKGKK